MAGNDVKIVIVAAVARNGVIGADNRLLWRLKSDMKHFRALTMGKAMVMGRKTFDSIGKALPGRHIIVVTRDRNWRAEGVTPVHDLEAALEEGRRFARESGTGEVIIAGGGEIYAAMMPRADRLEITSVALEPEGDTLFPPVDPSLWREETRRSFTKSGDDEADFAFISHVRR